jgi:hypothetical protein
VDVGITTQNATYANRRVVDLPSEPLGSQEPAVATDGVDLLPGDSITLDPGTYVITTTFRGYDIDGEGPDPAVQYGVAALFLDGQRQTSIWTPDIPADGNNAAVASDTTVIGVASGADGVLTVRGVVRQNAGAIAGSTAEGGVTVVVTGVNTG